MEKPNNSSRKILTFGTGIWFVTGCVFFSLYYKIFYFLGGHRPGVKEEILGAILALGFGWFIRRVCEKIAGGKL